MVAFKDTSTLAALLVLSIIGTAGSVILENPWSNLEMFQESAIRFEYNGISIGIYEVKEDIEKSDREKTYVFTPVIVLDHLSSRCIHNEVSGKFEVRFLVRFWNDDLKKEVASHLKIVTGAEVDTSDVSVISFDEVMLTSSTTSQLFTIENEWIRYHNEKSVGFYLNSESLETCNRTVQTMRKHPSMFRFKMYFSLSLNKKDYTGSLAMEVLTDKILKTDKSEFAELQGKVRLQGIRIRKLEQDNTTLAKHFLQALGKIENKVNEIAEYIRKLEDREKGQQNF